MKLFGRATHRMFLRMPSVFRKDNWTFLGPGNEEMWFGIAKYKNRRSLGQSHRRDDDYIPRKRTSIIPRIEPLFLCRGTLKSKDRNASPHYRAETKLQSYLYALLLPPISSVFTRSSGLVQRVCPANSTLSFAEHGETHCESV